MDLANIVAFGQLAARTSCPGDDDEFRKRITAIAYAGDPSILIDNIGAGGLRSASLDSCLTADVWKDRLLGKSEILQVPITTVWAATGNNVVLGGDLHRRVLHVRLQSPVEHPEERTDFRHRDVIAYARSSRSALLAAALTLLRAYCVEGRPVADITGWGSYEGWSGLVRQALVWAGEPDPAGLRRELALAADSEGAAFRALLQSWHLVDPSGVGIATADLLRHLREGGPSVEPFCQALLEMCPPRGGSPFPTAGSIGSRLGHRCGQVVDGKQLVR